MAKIAMYFEQVSEFLKTGYNIHIVV